MKYCHPRIKCCLANSLAALIWRWCLNNKQAALQLRVDGSRRGDGEQRKRLPILDSHVDGGDGAKTVVYNTKEDSKKRGTEKEIQERKREKKVEEIQQ